MQFILFIPTLYVLTPTNTISDQMESQTQEPKNEKNHQVLVPIKEVEREIFGDQTGCFPVTYNQVNSYVVVFYIVNSNSIKSVTIKIRVKYKLLRSYESMYSYLTERGCKPKLHKLYNKNSKDVENFSVNKIVPSSIPHQICTTRTLLSGPSKKLSIIWCQG